MTLFSHGRRKKKKEGRNNPHLGKSRINDPTCLTFGVCCVGVWRVSGNLSVSVGCLVAGGCLKGVLRISMGCLNGNLVSQDW